MSTHLPHLSHPQAQVLALWSDGIALTQTCGMTPVVVLRAQLRGQRENTVRQRLREWCDDAADKRGAQRQAVEVASCFAPLLRGMRSGWAGEARRLALALEATTLGARFTVLAESRVSRGGAIPVAGKIGRAQPTGAWEPHWKALLAPVHGSVPADWTVRVLADRGLYARWLHEAMRNRGWHPYLRVNAAGP